MENRHVHKSSNYSLSYLEAQRNDVLVRVKITSMLYKALQCGPVGGSYFSHALALENREFTQRLCSLRSMLIASMVMLVEQVSTLLQVRKTRLFKNTSILT